MHHDHAMPCCDDHDGKHRDGHKVCLHDCDATGAAALIALPGESAHADFWPATRPVVPAHRLILSVLAGSIDRPPRPIV
ncbi:hypothetical protein ACLB0R_06875 [Sphingomonas sp. GlSt437]